VAYVIIVTGWRYATWERHALLIQHRLYMATAGYVSADVTLKHGKCPRGGVDLIADKIARERGWNVQEFPAEFRNGKLLGPERNQRMVDTGADIVLAFPGPSSRGTIDCLTKAIKAGITTHTYPLTR
jgi:hypothetical protein